MRLVPTGRDSSILHAQGHTTTAKRHEWHLPGLGAFPGAPSQARAVTEGMSQLPIGRLPPTLRTSDKVHTAT